MNRTFVAGLAAAALVSGGMAVMSPGFGAGTARAEVCSAANANTPPCAPPEGLPACNAFGDCGQLWCPGSGMGGIPDWDMSVCHTFHWDPTAPLNRPIIIPGNPPGPPAPPPPPCIPLVNCLPGLTQP